MKKAILSPLCSLTLCLSAVLLVAGLAAQIARAFVPNVILPPLDIPTLAALSLIALVLEAIFFGQQHRFWATSLIVGIVDFGLLSLCAGQAPTALEALRVGILGGAVCLVCEVLLHSILDRLSSGAVGKHRRSMAVVSALLLWLAVQIPRRKFCAYCCAMAPTPTRKTILASPTAIRIWLIQSYCASSKRNGADPRACFLPANVLQ